MGEEGESKRKHKGEITESREERDKQFSFVPEKQFPL